MTISKNEFKIIYNHMKSLSQSKNQNLIQQATQGKTHISEINNIITAHSSEKVVKLMKKINNFMSGGADGLSDNTTSSVVPESVTVVDSATSSAVPESVVNSTTSEMVNLDVNNVDSIKDSVREIIDKLKTKSDLLKEKETQLVARETEIKIKEDTLKDLTTNIEKLEKIKQQLILDISKIPNNTESTSDKLNIKLGLPGMNGFSNSNNTESTPNKLNIKLGLPGMNGFSNSNNTEQQGGNTESESNFLSEIFS